MAKERTAPRADGIPQARRQMSRVVSRSELGQIPTQLLRDRYGG